MLELLKANKVKKEISVITLIYLANMLKNTHFNISKFKKLINIL